MLICKSCGHAFTENEDVCPNCHSEEITDAFYCGICDRYEPVAEQEPGVSFTGEDGNELEVCAAQTGHIMAEYLKIMRDKFTPDERSVIASYVYSNGDMI